MNTTVAPAIFQQPGSGESRPSGVFVELPELRSCFYRQRLNPGKPTLLLLHGMIATSGLNWFRLFPALARHFNVIAPDMRGHGRSARGSGRFTLARVADDMAALVEVTGCGPVIAVGYSMGGAVAQYLWRRHPQHVSGLVLAATTYRKRVARHEELFALPMFAAMVGIGNVVELSSHLPRGLVKRFLPRLADQLHEDETRWALDELRRTSLRVVMEAAREMSTHDASAWLGEIDVPVAVVCTERDRAIPAQYQAEMADLIAGAELFRYDQGHLACMEPAFGLELARAARRVAQRARNESREARRA